MSNHEFVSSELRHIENEIDNDYLGNPLMTLPFSEACWNVMAYYEDFMVKNHLRNEKNSVATMSVIADYLMVHIKYPVYWVYKTCKTDTSKPNSYNGNNYKSARQLFELTHNYDMFVTAFTYASHGIRELKLNGGTIYSENGLYTDIRYEAYDRLMDIHLPPPNWQAEDPYEIIERNTTISGDRFHFQIGERILHNITNFMHPMVEGLFELPDDWEFEYYSIDEFRKMAKSLLSLAYLQYTSRIIACRKGCNGLGINNSILNIASKRLNNILSQSSGVDYRKVENFIADLTYGSKNLRFPDPALQPLIILSKGSIGLMPSLLLNNSLERNWIVLINRLPDMRTKYLSLVQSKETFMIKKILRDITNPKIERPVYSLRLPEPLPDIDLVLISDINKFVFIIELKWFVAPSEAREVIEKSQEIAKGIEQIRKIEKTFYENPDIFYRLLNIDSSYSVVFLVLSKNMIGQDYIQDSNIPVLQSDHFVRKLNLTENMSDVAKWISKKEYLPVEGVHFDVRSAEFSIRSWRLNWYGIKPRINTVYI